VLNQLKVYCFYVCKLVIILTQTRALLYYKLRAVFAEKLLCFILQRCQGCEASMTEWLNDERERIWKEAFLSCLFYISLKGLS